MIFKFSEPSLKVVPVNELTSFLAVLRDTSAQFCWRFEVA